MKPVQLNRKKHDDLSTGYYGTKNIFTKQLYVAVLTSTNYYMWLFNFQIMHSVTACRPRKATKKAA